MKKLSAIILIIVLLTTLSTVAVAQEERDYMITFTSHSIPKNVVSEMKAHGAEVIQEVPQIGVIQVRSSNPEFLAWARGQSSIALASENIQARSSKLDVKLEAEKVNKSVFDTSGADLFEEHQWNIKRVTNNGKVWGKTTGSHDVVVAIIDLGVDFNHPDLKDNMLYGKSFIPGVPDQAYFDEHGTQVAGIIAANGRLLGVGPNLGLASYLVNPGDFTSILAGIITAADDGVDVANISMGAYSVMNNEENRNRHLAASRAVRYAESKGMLLVAANGNDGLNLRNRMNTVKGLGAQWSGPLFDTFSDIPGVISVSATTRMDTLADYSNYGNVTLAAPGGDTSRRDFGDLLYTTIPSDYGMYGYAIGTSLAAPHVAAAAALIKEQNPNMTPAQIRTRLQQSADGGKGTSRKYFGHGIVNVYNALNR